jgi:hypothetical protein
VGDADEVMEFIEGVMFEDVQPRPQGPQAGHNSLWKKAIIHSVHETTVPEAEVFPQELALAKPVAHDEFAMDRFFNGLREIAAAPGA